MFLWRACIGAVPTMFSLTNRISNVCSNCPGCKFKAKTMLHALWMRSRVKLIWKALDIYTRLQGNRYVSFIDLCFDVLIRFPVGDREIFAWGCWALWNNRNTLVHEGSYFDIVGLANKILNMHHEFCDAVKSTISPMVSPQRWVAPAVGNLKINVDASVPFSGTKFGLGVVVRNHFGDLMGALAKPLSGRVLVLTAELMALHTAFVFCVEAGFSIGVIESDSRQTISRLRDDSFALDENCVLVEKIQKLLSSLFFFPRVHVPRTANVAADRVAKYAVNLTTFVAWLETVLTGCLRLFKLIYLIHSLINAF